MAWRLVIKIMASPLAGIVGKRRTRRPDRGVSP
jgi:hypothetical protein